MAINKFTGATSANWATSTNWSQGTVPTAVDGHVTTFDATSPACTINAVANVNAIDFTGYTNSITFSFTLNLWGNITFSSGMTMVSGAGIIYFNTSNTITSNGKTINIPMTLAVTSGTYTLGDNLTMSATLTQLSGSSITLNGNTLYVSGSLTLVSGTVYISGTTNIVFNGTGTWSGSQEIRNNVTINTAGTLTLSGAVSFGVGTFTYTAGTVTTTGSTMQFCGANTTSLTTVINAAGISFGSVSFSSPAATNVYTLSSAIVCTSLLYTNNALTTINGFTITASGSFTPLASTISDGTTNIVLNGTGTWTNAGTIRNNLTINTAGTITISASVAFGLSGRTLTYTAGTVTTTGSTLFLNASCTLNTSGMTWNAISLNAVVTITNNSALTMTGLLNIVTSGSSVINGSSLTIHGGYTASSGRNLSGTALLIFGGSGTQTLSTGNTATIGNSITFNTAGTITLGAIFYLNSGTLTYTAGTINLASTTLYCLGSITFDTSGLTWINVTLAATMTATLTSTLNVSGLLTLSISGAGTITWAGAGTLNTTGGLSGVTITTTFPNALSFTSMTINGVTLNGPTITNTGSLTLVTNTCNGSATFLLAGTGTWSGSPAFSNPLTINTSGTITISGTVSYSSNTLTYTAGTVNSNGSSLLLYGTLANPAIFNTDGMSFYNITLTQNPCYLTLTSHLTCSNNFGNGNNISHVNGLFNLYMAGLSLTTGGSPLIDGTTTFVFNGTGIWSVTSPYIHVIKNNIVINTAGTLTITNTVNFNTGTLTYTAGTVVSTGATLNIVAATTLNTSGMSWNAVLFGTASFTTTLLSNLVISGIMQYGGGTYTYSGAYDIYCGTHGSFSTGNILNYSQDVYVSTLIYTNLAASCTFNGRYFYCSGNVTIGSTAGTGTWNGTATFIICGTGTFKGATATGIMTSNVIFDTTGTITFDSFTLRGNTKMVFNQIGTMIWGSTILTVNQNNVTFEVNMPGIVIPTLQLGGLVSLTNFMANGSYGFDMTNLIVNPANFGIIGWKSTNTYNVLSGISSANGTLASRHILKANKFNLVANTKAQGNKDTSTSPAVNTTGSQLITMGCSFNNTKATPVITDSYGNTWTALTRRDSTGAGFTATVIYYCINPIVGTSHTFTVTRTDAYSTIYVQAFTAPGTITCESENGVGASATNTNTFTGAVTPTTNGSLIVTCVNYGTGTLTSLNGNAIITDTSGYSALVSYGGSCAYLSQPVAALTNLQWVWGTTNISASSIACFKSTSTTKAVLTFQGTTQDVSFLDVSEIDNSLGQTVWMRKGTITTTNNWNFMTAPKCVGNSFLD